MKSVFKTVRKYIQPTFDEISNNNTLNNEIKSNEISDCKIEIDETTHDQIENSEEKIEELSQIN
jgi:hypothetical protein